MNLYFQFLTQNQTSESARLLEAINIFAGDQALKGQAKLHASGKISRIKFSKIDTLVDRLTYNRFNELNLNFDTGQCRFHIGDGLAHVESVACKLSISPTCDLWLPVRDWRTDGDRSSDNRYLTAKSRERALAFHQINKEPSVLGIYLTVKTRLTEESLLDECALQMATRLPQSLDNLHVFGCCDVLQPLFIPQLRKNIVMPQIFEVMLKVKPLAYPELGKKLENLHPLMFGSKKLCKGISGALGKAAKLIMVKGAEDVAVVRLYSTHEKKLAKSLAADWLIKGAEKLT